MVGIEALQPGLAVARGFGGRWRRVAYNTGMAVAVLAVLFGAYIGILLLSGNFHEVLPGQYYRSAQLSGARLAAEIDRYGIKTVINLRGEHGGTGWYDDEVAASEGHGATHVDFGFSARKDLTPEKMQALVALLKTAEQPVLVHCLSGADRTGLASVIFLQQVAGVAEDEAEWQLSPLYGHFNLPFLATSAMDDSWEALEKAIGLES